MTPPTVFISYSHDSAEHKEWVVDFATTLMNRGADVVLDQWSLGPGDDLPQFIETQIASCDHVIAVCTETYVTKANAGEGGVGYEKMILTPSLLGKINDSKIIPIVRQSSSVERPAFLRSKVYINFSNDSAVEYSLDKLLRKLFDAPLFKKPKIGDNPFIPLSGSKPDRTVDGVNIVMIAVAKAFENNSNYNTYVMYSSIVDNADCHILFLNEYIKQAILLKLLTGSQDYFTCENIYYVSSEGVQYLMNHNLISKY